MPFFVLAINPYTHIVDDDLLDPLDRQPMEPRARAGRDGLADAPAPRRRVRPVVTGALVLLALFVALHARGHGYKTRVLHRLFPHAIAWLQHPGVTGAHPGHDESNVAADAFISVEVQLPNDGAVVDAATVNSSAVRLYRTGDHQPVDATVNTTAAGDAVVLKPAHDLDLNTTYTVQILPSLKDTSGASFAPYKTRFTTAASRAVESFPAAFEKVALPSTEGHRFTAVTVGPDHKLYASTFHGFILRFAIWPDGTLGPAETVVSPRVTKEPRLITGICFDPSSTPGNLLLWVTNGQLKEEGADDWTGRISRLSGRNLDQWQDVVVGLPRGRRDHLTNQLSFGPDGALYVCQASNSAMGGADPGWGNRPERLLNAAILRVDTHAITAPPLDVKTEAGGHYDPFAPGAPVTLYATGLRNAFDLLWHRNGNLYAPINGSSAGGNVPEFAPPANDGTRHPRRIDESPDHHIALPPVMGITNVRLTEQDLLARVVKGGYYGHPNPTRGEYVLDGGNPLPSNASTATTRPTTAVATVSAPFRVSQYPPGTKPDPNWRLPAFDFGKHLAPCGLIEYQGDAFGGALDGKILVTRYSGGKDIIVLTPGDPATGTITEALSGIEGLSRFADPLDLTEDLTTGFLYVAEHEGEKITLLRPRPGVISTRVFRQVPAHPTSAPPAH